MRISYQQLKSQIDTGLAEEVFASLSIPLMKLVGLKTVDMASEGRFTAIVIDDNDLSQRNGGVAGDRNNQTSAFESMDDRACHLCRVFLWTRELQDPASQGKHFITKILVLVNYLALFGLFEFGDDNKSYNEDAGLQFPYSTLRLKLLSVHTHMGEILPRYLVLNFDFSIEEQDPATRNCVMLLHETVDNRNHTQK